MIKIFGEHGSGKTKQLLEKAFDNNMIVVCKDPSRMSIKADTYGFPGLTFLSYDFYKDQVGANFTNKAIVIDDLDEFLKSINPDIKGYSVSTD